MNSSSYYELEEGAKLALDYEKLKKVVSGSGNALPAVVQDCDSKDVLLIAYVNQEALERSLSTGIATFWSTSRNELWVKGTSSGDFLDLDEVRVNCEQNSLLFLVRPRATGACHTTNPDGETRSTCFYRAIRDGSLTYV